MIECNINNISKTFGADLIFEHISFEVKSNEKIGLIGPNGSGKTTLIKMIYGLEHISDGNISFRKGLKIGYLDQIPDYDDGLLVKDILNSAFIELHEMKEEIDQLALSFTHLKDNELDIALRNYSNLHEQFELQDGYNIDTLINKVCTGLKINEVMQDMEFNVLSGGEKTRVMLAKILLEKPGLLMLDEPSNHLDLESIEWLESYLSGYEGSVLIVSHDRYFLDNVCKKIVELSTYKAHVFHGNYSYYVIEKERRFLLELKVYMAQERKISRMEEQIKRYRIWGVMRDSDKMFKRAKELERRLSKIERLDKPKYGNQKMKIVDQMASRSGKRVLSANNINKSFDDLNLLKDAFIELIFQDRLAILGNNGSGKTTLIKLLLNDFSEEEQKYKWGSKLKVGYLAQEVSFPDEDLTVLDFFMSEHNVTQNEARNELAKGLFIRDDVYKKIKVLSGGEKSKLTLLSMMFNKTNFLILDEPTNHLDIDSREILEEMLLDFKGTILFISHDRYFIRKIATRIGEIDNLIIKYYEGDYDYYKYLKAQQIESIVPQKKLTSKPKEIKEKKQDTQLIYAELEKIEEQVLLLESSMKEHSYDAIELKKLYDQKEILEHEYQLLYDSLED